MQSELLQNMGLAMSVIVAVIVLALNFTVQVATIQGKSNLKRRVYTGSGICLLFGILFLVVGMLAQCKVFTWTTPAYWISAGSVLIISVAIPMWVQGLKLGKTGPALARFASDLHITARTLVIIAVVALVILILAIAVLFVFSLLKPV